MDSQESNPLSSPIDVEFDEATAPVKRKNKSLLALCKRFLEIYPLDMPQGSSLDIPLEHLSEKLKLSRRRLYDIINIMESLQMAVKVTKNLYRWYGTRNVQALLTQLKDISDREMCLDLIQLPCPVPCTDVTEMTQSEEPMQPPCTPQGDVSAHTLLIRSLAHLPQSQYVQPPCTPQGQNSGRSLLLTPMAPPTPHSSTKKRQCTLNNIKESPEPKKPDHWKMKSLGGTCLKFLALFFKHQTVSLDWAGRVLLCGDDDDKPSSQESEESNPKEQDRQLRNKVRRIYDVANVLCALGLVCKISPRYSSSRKLLYAYSGPAIGNLIPAVPAGFVAETASIEPPKPSRRVKKLDLKIEEDSREQRQTMDGVCKRRLDLSKVQESPHCKRLLQDDSLLEDSGTCALSILLAVAERELKGYASPRPDVPSTASQAANTTAISEIKMEPASPAMTSPELQSSESYIAIQPKSECNQQSNQSEQDYISPTKENEYEIKDISLSKPIINQPVSFNNGNRSALRSLLENNRTAPVKSEFPIIQKFVVLNEENIQSRVTITPANRPPIQTVVIRNVSGACQVMRRNGLSIPWQLNLPATPSRNIVTHLDIGLGKPSMPQ